MMLYFRLFPAAFALLVAVFFLWVCAICAWEVVTTWRARRETRAREKWMRRRREDVEVWGGK